MGLLTCYAMLAHRISRQSRSVFGVPSAGRPPSERSGGVGFCSNLLPILSEWWPDHSFATALGKTKTVLLEALENESYAFASIMEEHVRHREGSEPRISTIVNYDREKSLTFEQLKVERLFRPVSYARFDLALDVVEGYDGVFADWDYNSALFKRSTIERWADRFLRLVQECCEKPGASLRTLTDNYAFVDVDSSRSRTDNHAEQECVRHAFEPQVLKRVSDIALKTPTGEITFGQLDERATRLSLRLRHLGVERGDRVVVLSEPSIDAVIGLLGVWKAGAAYVPMDPRTPLLRIEKILESTHPKAILTGPLGQQVIGLHNVIPIEGEMLSGNGDRHHAMPDVSPGDVAYIIFTSGSSGEPKGVAIEHRSVCNYVNSIQSRLGLDSGAQYLSLASFAVDLGYTALFSSLLTGGCFHVLPTEFAVDAELLASYMQEHPIDVLKVTPSHFEALLSVRRPERLMPRKALIFGGESLRWDFLDEVRRLQPTCNIVNHYGPAETTIGALVFILDSDRYRDECRTVPIGTPLDNVVALVLDGEQAPVGTGEVGELYIGGAGLARGFWEDPAGTEKRFVQGPLSGTDRLYRTGDFARRLDDGTFEFIGRHDRQVKVRGFRVELGEVERALASQPGIRECAVIYRSSRATGAQLIGFCSPEQDSTIRIDKIRRLLRQSLPQYMIPDQFVEIERLPRLLSGKIDYSQLSDIAVDDKEEVREYEQPATEVERQIASVMCNVLECSSIGRFDNFFSLGGNSLAAIQVIGRIRESLNIELPFRSLFEAPTIADLSDYVETLRWASDAVPEARAAAHDML